MSIYRTLLIVTLLLAGCDAHKQWQPPADDSFIDLSEGEVPEFKAAVDNARASVNDLKMLIEQHPDSQIQVLLFSAEDERPRYVWAKLNQQMLDSITYPFELTEVHPKWEHTRVGQPVAMTDIELIYDWSATVNGEKRGHFTKGILNKMNAYYP